LGVVGVEEEAGGKGFEKTRRQNEGPSFSRRHRKIQALILP